ncbi:MAG: hypothetical protein Ct9H90mP13_01580 [Pseudomonadota bacterium]|nr:MAG: hypothetical protein Ct9H90mP13_01580 [Pseudomonadota bacterium]
MLRITKMTDYAVLILANLALHDKKLLLRRKSPVRPYFIAYHTKDS